MKNRKFCLETETAVPGSLTPYFFLFPFLLVSFSLKAGGYFSPIFMLRANLYIATVYFLLLLTLLTLLLNR
jgi:hypothetical protein